MTIDFTGFYHYAPMVFVWFGILGMVMIIFVYDREKQADKEKLAMARSMTVIYFVAAAAIKYVMGS